MRVLRLVSVLALAGCASGNVPGVQPDVAETVRISGGATGGMQISTNTSAASNVVTVALPLTRIWLVLPSVYDSLGIPVNLVDTKTHVIGNAGYKTRRQLGKVPLSHYINCGNTQGPPSADTYEIQLTVTTQLTPDASATGTVITTTVESLGRAITLSGEYSRCASKGTLESTIIDVIKAKL
jgi:hypothetical protein